MSFPVATPSPGRRSGMAAAVLLVLWIGQLGLPQPDPPPSPPDRSAPAEPPVAPLAAGAPAPVALPDRADAPPLAVRGIVEPAQAPAAADCGKFAAGRGETLAARLGAMQSVADERQRAAAWLIGFTAGDASARDRLATLAAASADPLVQAYAQRACRSDAASSSACQALDVEAWTRIEPDNAAAWLALAADPRADAPLQRQALHRAAGAGRFDTHMPSLHQLAEAPPAAQEGEAEITAAVLAARADWLATEALREYCDRSQLEQDELRADCASIADLVLTQAQTLPDLQQAYEIGTRLGWPAERLDALRDDASKLAALRDRLAEPDDPADCGADRARAAFFSDVGGEGEVAALRRAMAGAEHP